MRIYINPYEMYEETKRDLAEMGILVKPKTMQDKVVEGNSDYYTKELQNYSYMLLNPSSKEVNNVMPVVNPWADAEFEERITNPFITGSFINPGEAYKLRHDVWDEYIHDGKMAYTYNELIWNNDQCTKVINRLKFDPESRQLWISLWDPTRDPDLLGGISRVPCSLGYGFQVREGKLNMHYVMRSCDFSTHFSNDVYLAIKFLEWVAAQTGYEVGSFTHTIFSLHVYQKDVKDVF